MNKLGFMKGLYDGTGVLRQGVQRARPVMSGRCGAKGATVPRTERADKEE